MDEKPQNGKSAWAWPVAWIATVVVLAAAGVYVFKSCRDLPGDVIDQSTRAVQVTGQQLAALAAAFKQGTVTTTFTSYATEISGSQYLQFATLSQQERFTRTDESSLAYGYIPLPEVIVEANAPVTFTYYLDLTDRWDFRLEDGVVTVVAPPIQFNKPAIDASRITYEIKKGSFFRDTDEAMENLKRSLTLMSWKKAEANVALVRETGRRQTEQFVQNWLARSFSDGKRYTVKVRFRNEDTPKKLE